MTRHPLAALLLVLVGCGASSASNTTPAAGDDAGPAGDTGLLADGTASDGKTEAGDATPSKDAPPSTDAPAPVDAPGSTDAPPAAYWYPRPGTSWQWQISGTLDTSFDVKVYDVDLFNTTDAQMTALHDAGRKVVCYFDTAYEPGRPDSTALEPYKGNPMVGWPGQFWIDIRQPAVLAVMKARIELAKTKRCDAIEGDDVDARSNDPGFPITAADQQGFIRTLAAESHARGMSYALKNDLSEIDALLADVDFSVNEECFRFSECDQLKPFVTAGKAVLQVEYTDGDLATKGATVCPMANALDFDTLIKHLDLGPPRYACR